MVQGRLRPGGRQGVQPPRGPEGEGTLSAAPQGFFIVPRWSGQPDSDFYPWLLGLLRAEAPPAFEARALALPRPDQPEVAAWVNALAGVLDPEPAERTVLLGHSVGCQAMLRYLAAQPPGRCFAGVLLVAGWWTVDSPWETLRPWMEPLPELARVRAAARRFQVLLSDNDPFTSDFEQNGQLWRERLGAEVTCVPGARHFNGQQEPAVLEALRSLAR